MINFRETTEKDLPFIYNSWLKSARSSYANLPSIEYFQMKKKECEEILKNSKVIVACSEDDQNFIFGYIVYKIIDDVCILHWAYVKSVNRKLKIARSMLEHVYQNAESNPIFITHRTYLIDKISEKYQFVFKPEYRSK